jgi:hypothetical protein
LNKKKTSNKNILLSQSNDEHRKKIPSSTSTMQNLINAFFKSLQLHFKSKVVMLPKKNVPPAARMDDNVAAAKATPKAAVAAAITAPRTPRGTQTTPAVLTTRAAAAWSIKGATWSLRAAAADDDLVED